MTKTVNYIPSIYDVAWVNLPFQGEFSLHGYHPCVIYEKIGSNYRIVPISSCKGNIQWCEYPLEEGRCNLKKKSKLKLDQDKNVSIEQIKYKIGIADNNIRIIIKDFLINRANNIQLQ